MTFTLRAPTIIAESVVSPITNLRNPLVYTEPVTGGSPKLRISRMFTEILYQAGREAYQVMSGATFPVLQGLSYSVHKIPNFTTRVSKSTNGREVRTAYQDMPLWTFQLTYDYLPDRAAGVTDLENLVGFFLQRRGSYDTFLFQDVDDYQTVNSPLDTPDGGNSTFALRRTYGGFSEIIGQLDTSVAPVITVVNYTQTGTIPPASGPYTITATHNTGGISATSVKFTSGGAALTLVTGAPGNNQYAVNTTTGVFTFNSLNANAGVTLTYTYTAQLATDYSILMPNEIVFTTPPPLGSSLLATFQFYYVCRFTDDQLDFEKFMDKLWQLGECDFVSVIS